MGIPTIIHSLEVQLPMYDFAIKIILTVVTIDAGFKGEEVTSLFLIGAIFGSAISLLLPLPTASLAGMGLVAVLAGTTSTLIACTILAIELFGIKCGLYVAIAYVVSYLFSDPISIYGSQVIGEPNHFRYSHHRGKRIDEL